MVSDFEDFTFSNLLGSHRKKRRQLVDIVQMIELLDEQTHGSDDIRFSKRHLRENMFQFL